MGAAVAIVGEVSGPRRLGRSQCSERRRRGGELQRWRLWPGRPSTDDSRLGDD
jgi:hypothetical protein